MFKILQILALVFFSHTVLADSAEEILSIDRAFSKLSAAQGRAVAYPTVMSENPTSLEQGLAPKYGKAAILQGFKAPADGSIITVSWKPEAGKIAASGDLAYTWGIYTYQVDHEGETSISEGKYITVWIKENGEWKLATEMSNDNPNP